jgi:dihydrofolate reductase
MRKVVAWLFVSLDGVVEAPNEWQFDSLDEDMGADITAQIAAEDAILLGRVTYEAWAAYWPTSTDEPFASHINKTPKYVFSTTLDEVKWENCTLVKGDPALIIGRLKEQPGKNIGVSGSPTLVEYLLEAGLLDQLKLMIHPVVVRKGKRLFQDGETLNRLKLVDSKITGTGVAILTYEPLS